MDKRLFYIELFHVLVGITQMSFRFTGIFASQGRHLFSENYLPNRKAGHGGGKVQHSDSHVGKVVMGLAIFSLRLGQVIAC